MTATTIKTTWDKLRTGYANLARPSNVLEPFALLVARFAAARVFFQSGLTKWDGPFSFNVNKYDLFLYEYFCPEEPRHRALTLCSDRAAGTYDPTMQWIVERFANLTGILEIILPALLILGLFGRFAAFGLLIMTLFIELFVFPGADSWWGSHLWWTVALLIIVARGPGAFSIDRLIRTEPAGK